VTAQAASRSDERRRAILDAALACFGERGFQATSMEEIRARSSASVGSIYHHFESKERLAAALYLEGLAAYQDGFVAALARHRDAERGVKAMVHQHLAFVSAQPELAAYLLSMRNDDTVTARQADARALRQEFFRRVFAWIAPRRARGEIKALADHVLVALVIGPSQEYGRYWLGHRDPRDLARARTLLANAAWESVRPVPHRERQGNGAARRT